MSCTKADLEAAVNMAPENIVRFAEIVAGTIETENLKAFKDGFMLGILHEFNRTEKLKEAQPE